MNISRIINIFLKRKDIFEFLEDNFDKVRQELLGTPWEELKTRYNSWKKNPMIQEKIKFIINNKQSIESKDIEFYLVKDFLKEERIRKLILNILELILINLEEFIVSTPLFDKELFFSFIEHMKRSIKSNDSESRYVFEIFGEKIFEEQTFFLILEDIAILQEKLDLENYSEKINDTKFTKYMRNLLVNYEHLIEGPIKSALIFLLKLQKISSNKDYKYLDKKNYYIREILQFLKINKLIANYRNSIAHENFEFRENPEGGDKRVILRDQYNKIIVTFTIAEFNNEFWKANIFIINLYFAALSTYIKLFIPIEKLMDFILSYTESVMKIIGESDSYDKVLLEIKNFPPFYI